MRRAAGGDQVDGQVQVDVAGGGEQFGVDGRVADFEQHVQTPGLDFAREWRLAELVLDFGLRLFEHVRRLDSAGVHPDRAMRLAEALVLEEFEVEIGLRPPTGREAHTVATVTVRAAVVELEKLRTLLRFLDEEKDLRVQIEDGNLRVKLS